jgi:hypothetical protein
MEEDLDTFEPTTPCERAVAKRLGLDVEHVKLILDTFEEEFDRIETIKWEREKNGNSGTSD